MKPRRYLNTEASKAAETPDEDPREDTLTEYLVAAQVSLPDGSHEQRHYAVYEPTPERARTTVVKTWGARGFTPTERPTVARVTDDSHRRGTRVITGP